MYNSPSKTPLYMDLYLKLREKIESGEFPVGYKLDSEKQIAEENGVSRITSKHALDQLVSEGYIKRFPGKGSFVQSRTGAPQSEFTSVHSENGHASRLIGVIMEDVSPDFGGRILMGIERQCAEAGYSLVLKFSYGDENREIACVEELLAAGVCGILVMCVYSEVYSPTIMKLSLEGFPMVFMDRSLRGLPVPFVGTNHLAAAKDLTCELIARGHSHLALAMDENSRTTSSIEDRILGYVEACLNHNLLCANNHLSLMREDAGRPDPQKRAINIRRIREFLRDNPRTKGILAMTANIADTLMQAIEGDSEYTIASFDGPRSLHDAPCAFFYVEQDQDQMGRTACRQLIEKLHKREVPHQTYVPYKLIQSPRTQED